MSKQLTVNANIVDICTDTPKATDSFLVDTNVWICLTYPKAILANYKADYVNYINEALKASATIYYCGLTLSEISHQIEKFEYETFKKIQNNQITAKDFRHNYPPQRMQVISELEASWNQIKSMSVALPVNINLSCTNSAFLRYKAEKVDGYDLFLLEAMKENGITNILTNDSDFVCTPNITVFTSNTKALGFAKKQNKIILR